jgi:hypothetical protein
MNTNLKRFLLVLGFLTTAAVAHRIGQFQAEDAAKAAIVKANAAAAKEARDHGFCDDLSNLRQRELELKNEEVQHEFISGVALTEKCHQEHDQSACDFLRGRLAEWRVRVHAEQDAH